MTKDEYRIAWQNRMDQILAKALQNPMYHPDRKKKLDFKILATYADGSVYVSINGVNYKYGIDTAYCDQIDKLYRGFKPGKALALLKKVARSCKKLSTFHQPTG